MAQQRQIVIFEDEQALQGVYRRQLEHSAVFMADYEVQFASTAQEGLEQFVVRSNDIALIVMDGKMPGSNPLPPDVVRRIRELGFAGDIVANSSHPDLQEELKCAGCNHVSTDKLRVVDKVLQLLHIS